MSFIYMGDLETGIPAKWQDIWDQIAANFTPVSTNYLIDRGIAIPGITDGFSGTAPDIGAFESTP